MEELLGSPAKLYRNLRGVHDGIFFYDAGNAPPGSPLPVQNAMVEIGCAAGVCCWHRKYLTLHWVKANGS